MRLWLVALVLTMSVPVFTTEAEAACAYYNTDDFATPVGWDDHFARTQRYRCNYVLPAYSYEQRVDILRVADGNPDGAHTVLAQLEFQSILKRFHVDGREERSHFVALHDTQGILGFTEVEYTDTTTANGACAARANLYRGSSTSKTATSTLPSCVPTLGLLP